MIEVKKPTTILDVINGQKVTAKRIDFEDGDQDHIWKESDKKATKEELTSAKTELEASLADKADASDITTINETLAGKASQEDLDSLSGVVDGKAEQTEVDTLSSSLASKAEQSQVDSLASSVADKASQADLNDLSGVVDNLDTSKLIKEESSLPSDGVPSKIISVASKLYVYQGNPNPGIIHVEGADYNTGGFLSGYQDFGVVFVVMGVITNIGFSLFAGEDNLLFEYIIKKDGSIIYSDSVICNTGENKFVLDISLDEGEYAIYNTNKLLGLGFVRHNTVMSFRDYPHVSPKLNIVRAYHPSLPDNTYYWFYNFNYTDLGGNWVKIYDANIIDTDIPALPQSKITNLTTDLAAKASNSALSTAVADLSSDIAEKASNDDLDDTNTNVTDLQTSKASVSELARTTNMDIYSNGNLQSFIIGPAYSTATAFCTELGLFLEVRTPVWLAQTKIFMKSADNVLVQIYNYENDVVIYEESFSLAINENIIPIGVLLPAGRYYFSGTADTETLAYFPTTSYSITHHFVSVFGGELDPVAFPDFTPGTTNQWAGFYQMTFQVPFKALYLGLLSAKEPNENLIRGAFYHVNDSNYLRTWCFDGASQISN